MTCVLVLCAGRQLLFTCFQLDPILPDSCDSFLESLRSKEFWESLENLESGWLSTATLAKCSTLYCPRLYTVPQRKKKRLCSVTVRFSEFSTQFTGLLYCTTFFILSTCLSAVNDGISFKSNVSEGFVLERSQSLHAQNCHLDNKTLGTKYSAL